jgi:hypothetical protein
MTTEQRTRQLAFRLPHSLIERIEACEQQIRQTGLNLSRTDVVRLLLTYALNKSQSDLKELLSPTGAGPKPGARPRRHASESAGAARKAAADKPRSRRD